MNRRDLLKLLGLTAAAPLVAPTVVSDVARRYFIIGQPERRLHIKVNGVWHLVYYTPNGDAHRIATVRSNTEPKVMHQIGPVVEVVQATEDCKWAGRVLGLPGAWFNLSYTTLGKQLPWYTAGSVIVQT